MNYFAYLLTVVFVVAKILNYIEWSWLIVFLPMIVLFSIYFAIFLSAVVGWQLGRNVQRSIINEETDFKGF